MNPTAKNRLHDFEAGWRTLLLKMGVAGESELREAQNRVARQAIAALRKATGEVTREQARPRRRRGVD